MLNDAQQNKTQSSKEVSRQVDLNAYKVMIVDDSAVIIGMVRRILDSDSEIHVVTTAMNGEMALKQLTFHPEVEVIILDIEMPIMDGLTAIPLILKERPDIKIVMSSTLTNRNAEISLEAMKKGACDYIAKPTSTVDVNSGVDFRGELIGKVKVFGRQYREAKKMPTPVPSGKSEVKGKMLSFVPCSSPHEVEVKPMPVVFYADVVAIGSSTGGPQALFTVLAHLKNLSVPIFITQHMPETFTTIMADHITKQIGITCFEAQDGMIVENGKAYLARGGFHMGITKDDAGQVRLFLDKGEKINFCRPAVDFMMNSLATVYPAKKMLCAILTGMGRDGCDSLKNLSSKGSVVIAQNEETSVVWGMPGAVAVEGICNAIEPIQNIGPFIRKHIR